MRALLFVAILTCWTFSQASIYTERLPFISWTYTGGSSPLIKLYIYSDFNPYEVLTDFWMKIAVPFSVKIINGKWAYYDNCSEDQFNAIKEYFIESDSDYTYFYIQLMGSTYQAYKRFVLAFKPLNYMDFEGFTVPMKLELISGPYDSYVMFASNKALMHFYGYTKTNTNLVASLESANTACTALNRVCETKIKVQLTRAVSSRIVIHLTGDYTVADDIGLKCEIVRLNSLVQLNKGDYSCYKDLSFGAESKYISFKSGKGFVRGIYSIVLSLETPLYGGSNSLSLYVMDEYGSKITDTVSMSNISTSKPLPWTTGYPTMEFSFGFSGTAVDTPLGIGFFSMSTTYNQVYNTIMFSFMTDDLPEDLNKPVFNIEIYLGSVNILLPLGSIYENFDHVNSNKKQISLTDDCLNIKNINFYNGKIYQISFKIGFLKAMLLNSLESSGFGVLKLKHGIKTVISGNTVMNSRYHRVNENYNIFLPESVLTTQPGHFRGYSAFRTDYASTLLSTASNYFPSPTLNGLKFGDYQEFFFQSSAGPNSLYFSGALSPNQDSSKAFIEIITHRSLSSKVSNYEDKFATKNCKIFSSVFNKWSHQLVKADAQVIVDSTNTRLITIEPSSYNPISGCSYKKIKTTNGMSYSRFRVRLKDLPFKDQLGVDGLISGIQLIFASTADLSKASVQKGGLFVFNSVDVTEMPSEFYTSPNDSTVLDAFVRVYFYSNMNDINDEIITTPSISMMDNMYVTTKLVDAAFKSANVIVSPQNVYYQDTGTTITVNDSQMFPHLMHLHGQFDNLPTDTYAVKIQMNFIEPLVSDSAIGSVDCSAKGIKVVRCYIVPGSSNMLKLSTKTVTSTLVNLLNYNPRVSASLMVILDQKSVLPNSNFSLVFPYQLLMNDNLYKTITDKSGNVFAFPSFTLFNSTLRQLQYIDYGSTSQTYNVFAFHTSYDMASLPKLTNAQTATLDDVTVGNEPTKAAFVDQNGATVGGPVDNNILTICNDCVGYSTNNQVFSSASVCAPYNFYSSADFTADASNTDVITQCHTFQYEVSGRYCIYCPNIISGTTNIPLTSFKTATSNGLKWPSNTISVLSTQTPKAVTDFSSLNAVMVPNVVILVTDSIEVNQSQLSIQISIKIKVSNPLTSGNYIFMEKQVGDFLLSIKGQSNDYMCKISVDGVLSVCNVSMNLTKIIIGVKSSIPADKEITLLLFGVSVDELLGVANCQLTVYTALDDSGNATVLIDSSGITYLNIIYLESKSTGIVTLSNINLEPDIPGALTTLSFKISVSGREILETDQLIIDFGYNIIDDSLNVLLQEPITERTITSLKVVEILGSSSIRIQFNSAFNYKEFFVVLNSVVAPILPYPGVQVTYIFNEGYVAFSSNMIFYSLSDPLDIGIGKMKVNLNAQGFYNTLVISITPKTTVQRRDILYLKFSGNLSPSISQILWAFEDNYEFNKLKFWVHDSYTIALTGWYNTLDGERLFSFWMSGIAYEGINFVDLFIAGESGITYVKEVFRLYPNSLNESFGVKALYLFDYYLSSREIREFTDISLSFQTPIDLSALHYVYVIFDQLADEASKAFVPSCKISTADTKDGLAKSKILTSKTCQKEGNVIYFQILEDSLNYVKIEISNIPASDYQYCTNDVPRIYITNSTKRKILLSNPILLDNYDSSQLTVKDSYTMLNYKGLDNGVLETPRGFFSKFEVYPTRSSGLELFYQSEISFILVDNLSSTFSLTTLDYLSVDSLTSEVGYQTTPLALGVSSSAVLSTYLLPIKKQENSDEKYSNLPLLKVKVVSKQLKFEISEAVKVYVGTSSLPILLISEYAPFEEHTFKVQILDDPKGYLSLKDSIEEFSITPTKPIYKIVVNSKTKTDILRARILITPVDTSAGAPFATSVIQLAITSSPQVTGQNLIISLRETGPYSTKIDFTLDSEVYVVFYLAPVYAYKTLRMVYVENLVLKGIKKVGTTHFRAGVIYNYRQPLTFDIQELLANTNYKLTAYYYFPYSASVKQKDTTFTTGQISVLDGKMKLHFNTVVFMGRKIHYICQIAKKFNIAYENIWSTDGLNCNSSLIPKYQYERLNGLENWFNTTLSDMKLANLKSTSSDDGYTTATAEESIIETLVLKVPHLKYLELQISTSLKKNQSKTVYAEVFQSTRMKKVVKIWNLMLGDTSVIDKIDALIQIFYKDPPVVLNQDLLSPKATNSTVEINNIELSGKGQLLVLIDDQSEYYTPSKTEMMEVSAFQQFYYEVVDTFNSIFNIKFSGLTPFHNYTVYISTFNEDNRASSLMSDVKAMNITTAANETNKVFIAIVLATKIILLTLMLN